MSLSSVSIGSLEVALLTQNPAKPAQPWWVDMALTAVELEHIVDPGHFYARTLEQKESFRQLFATMNQYLQRGQLEPIQGKVRVGHRVGLVVDGSLYRATRTNRDYYLIDSGRRVESQVAFRLPQCFVVPPETVLRCHLSDVRPPGALLTEGWNPKAVQLFSDTSRSVLRGHTELQPRGPPVTMPDGGPSFPVEILFTVVGVDSALAPTRAIKISLSQTLLRPTEQQLAVPILSHEEESAVETEPSDEEDEDDAQSSSSEPDLIPVTQWRSPVIPSVDCILVRPTYVDVLAQFYCQRHDARDQIRLMRAQLANFYDREHEGKFVKATWQLAEPCMVRYLDGDLYRGIVVAVLSHKYNVLFVDFGNIEEISTTDMRVAFHFQDLPIQSLRFVLKDVVPHSNDHDISTIFKMVNYQVVHRVRLDLDPEEGQPGKLPLVGKLSLWRDGAWVDISPILVAENLGVEGAPDWLANYGKYRENAFNIDGVLMDEPVPPCLTEPASPVHSPYPPADIQLYPNRIVPCEVLCVFSYTNASIIIESKSREYQVMMKALTDEASQMPPVLPVPGLPVACLIYETATFYRGYVLNHEEVRLVDMQETSPLVECELKELPERFQKKYEFGLSLELSYEAKAECDEVEVMDQMIALIKGGQKFFFQSQSGELRGRLLVKTRLGGYQDYCHEFIRQGLVSLVD